MGTDTRGLWYNKQLFAKAGLPTDWQPKTWNDILTAARTIKQKVPGVTPFNVYSGKGAGEAATMQGFEMLLYGTERHAVRRRVEEVGRRRSKGLTDSLNFIKTVFSEDLGPTPQDALDPQLGQHGRAPSCSRRASSPSTSTAPGCPATGCRRGAKPWPQWNKVLGTAAMPTQNGQAPGKTSMSGGWTAVGRREVQEQAGRVRLHQRCR